MYRTSDDLDLPFCNLPFDYCNHRFNKIIIDVEPAGLHLTEQVSFYNTKVCCVDPSPLSMRPYNYGILADEFETLNLQNCLDKSC
ncbi:Lycopene cyclase-like [Trema orientale]|uniref:Lycopene cyclase-like n=1 Tax=Trema orientale TaxID=63057 RepID=A0A2P5BVA1_TREOI|nr:Lycopene cyclase-like [Trema orientale]